MFYELMNALFTTMAVGEAKQRCKGACAAAVSDESAPPAASKIAKVDLAADIKRLEVALYGGHQLEEGFCIDITLHDLLEICPRPTRRRRDAYKSLAKALSERGITLNIK